MINKKKPEEYIRKILKDEYHDEWKRKSDCSQKNSKIIKES